MMLVTGKMRDYSRRSRLIRVGGGAKMQRKMQRPLHLVFIVVCGLAACSKPSEQAEAPSAAAAAPDPATAATATATATAKSTARDLSSIDLCQLILPAEVATAAGGTLATEPSWKGHSCMYVIETPEGTESYLASVQAPDAARAVLDYQSDAERGERIDGLWDEAWLSKRDLVAEGYTLTVVRNGDLALEVAGDRRDVVLALARLATERLH